MLDFTKPILNKDPSYICNESGSLSVVNNVFNIFTEEIANLKYSIIRDKIKENKDDHFKLCALLSVLECKGFNIYLQEEDGSYTKIEHVANSTFNVIKSLLSPDMLNMFINVSMFKRSYSNIIKENKKFIELFEFMKNFYNEIDSVISEKVLINTTKYFLKPLLDKHEVTDIELIIDDLNLQRFKNFIGSEILNDNNFISSFFNIDVFFDTLFNFLRDLSYDGITRINRYYLYLQLDSKEASKSLDHIIDNIGIFKCKINGKPSLVIPLIFYKTLYLKIVNDKYPLYFYDLMIKCKSIPLEYLCIRDYKDKFSSINKKYLLPEDIYKKLFKGEKTFLPIFVLVEDDYVSSTRLLQKIHNKWKFPLTIVYSILAKFILSITNGLNSYFKDKSILEDDKHIIQISTNPIDSQSSNFFKVCFSFNIKDFSSVFDNDNQLNDIRCSIFLVYSIKNVPVIFDARDIDIKSSKSSLRLYDEITFLIKDNKVNHIGNTHSIESYRNQFKKEIVTKDAIGYVDEIFYNELESYLINNSSIAKSIEDELQKIYNKILPDVLSYKAELLDMINDFNNRFNPILYNGNYNNFIQEFRYNYQDLYDEEKVKTLLNKENIDFFHDYPLSFFVKDKFIIKKIGELKNV